MKPTFHRVELNYTRLIFKILPSSPVIPVPSTEAYKCSSHCLELSRFLVFVNLMEVRWWLIIILIWITQTTSNFEHVLTMRRFFVCQSFGFPLLLICYVYSLHIFLIKFPGFFSHSFVGIPYLRHHWSFINLTFSNNL